jgi:hypothetical protein
MAKFTIAARLNFISDVALCQQSEAIYIEDHVNRSHQAVLMYSAYQSTHLVTEIAGVV